MMGQEKSDGRVVPEARRKTGRTDASRGGKVATARETMGQLFLAFETAVTPQGNVAGADRGEPLSAPCAEPKSNDTNNTHPSPATEATMEAVANRENLKRSWQQVATNDGAAGPDKQSVDSMRERIDETLEALGHELLAGSYRPGAIRRVWIPKASGGQRGLGIPNVIDRIVQQAVHQVLSPMPLRFHCLRSRARKRRRMCPSSVSKVAPDVHTWKKVIQPIRYRLRRWIQSSTDCPQVRGTSCRIFTSMRSRERFDRKTSASWLWEFTRKPKPRKCLPPRATALLSRFTVSRMRPSRNRVTLAITR